MPTIKQIEANRRNAKKSTGPRTLEGKAAARGNALKTGLDAQAETMLPFEDPAKLEALTRDYYDRFTRATPEQRCLVDDLIYDEWQLRRFRAIEGQILTRRYDDAFTPRGVQFSLGQSYEYACKDLDRLQRRTTPPAKPTSSPSKPSASFRPPKRMTISPSKNVPNPSPN